MGRMAFIAAEKGMGTIQLTSRIINGKVSFEVPTACASASLTCQWSFA